MVYFSAMLLKEVIRALEELAPPGLQESYDNSGLLLGDPEQAITGVLICLDSTEEIVDEALAKGCNLIVAHHPIIFSGLKKITGKNYIERTVIKAIRNQVAIYAIHTNLDNVLHGVNGRIAARLELQNPRILQPKRDEILKLEVFVPTPQAEQIRNAVFASGGGHIGHNTHQDVGSGLVGDLENAMEINEFLCLVKQKMKAGVVRHTSPVRSQVQRVAVCGGSGSFLLNDAIAAGADVLVTSDFKYHQFFDADGKIVIADIGHFESEQFTIELLGDWFKQKFPTFASHLTEIDTNPVFYL